MSRLAQRANADHSDGHDGLRGSGWGGIAWRALRNPSTGLSRGEVQGAYGCNRARDLKSEDRLARTSSLPRASPSSATSVTFAERTVATARDRAGAGRDHLLEGDAETRRHS